MKSPIRFVTLEGKDVTDKVHSRMEAGEWTNPVADPSSGANGHTIGCYDFRAYCGVGCPHGEYGPHGGPRCVEQTGRTERECLREVRKRGWIVRRRSDGTEFVRCPKCRTRK